MTLQCGLCLHIWFQRVADLVGHMKIHRERERTMTDSDKLNLMRKVEDAYWDRLEEQMAAGLSNPEGIELTLKSISECQYLKDGIFDYPEGE